MSMKKKAIFSFVKYYSTIIYAIANFKLIITSRIYVIKKYSLRISELRGF